MNEMIFKQAMHEIPVVAAIKDDNGLKKCLECKCKIVFVLYGNISTIPSIVRELKEAGKIVFVHIDFIDGLSPREISVSFIKDTTGAHGIISTKSSLIKHAKSIGLLAIQRFFILDSISLVSIPKQLASTNADAIEVLPGIIPRVITRIVQENQTPVIAGGLISDKDDVVHAISAGAVAVSSTNQKVWIF